MPVQTTQIVAPQVRSGPFTSPTFSIPAGILNLELVANILLADKLSVGLTMKLDVERSPDAGANWFPVVGFGWTSYGPAGYPAGKDGIANRDPSIAFAPTAFLGQQFRLKLSIPQPLTVGATVNVTT